MGFSEQLTEILQRVPESRQTCLFSATLPRSLVSFTHAGLSNPTLIRLDVDSKLSPQLRVRFPLHLQPALWPPCPCSLFYPSCSSNSCRCCDLVCYGHPSRRSRCVLCCLVQTAVLPIDLSVSGLCYVSANLRPTISSCAARGAQSCFLLGTACCTFPYSPVRFSERQIWQKTSGRHLPAGRVDSIDS